MNGLLPRTKLCFFCGRSRGGPAIELFHKDKSVTCEFLARDDFQGYEGMLHAGITMGILDEVMWWTIFMATKELCGTVKMETEFKRPIYCGRIYRAAGRLVEYSEDIYEVTADIENESGLPCVISTASFRRMRGMTPEGFAKHFDFGDVSCEMQTFFEAPKP